MRRNTGSLVDSTVELLFVDDSTAHVQILRQALAEPGVPGNRIRVASNGRQALDFLLRRPPFEGAPRPDLILLDLDLPVLSGLDLLESIKQDPTLRAIPVVVFTRIIREGELAECYLRGANSVVVPPVPLDELSDTMRSIVRYWARLNVLPSHA